MAEDYKTNEIVGVTEKRGRRTLAEEVTLGQLLPHIIGGGGEQPDNLAIAIQLTWEIQQVRAARDELKSAFARSELDGGVKATYHHPLYIQAQERLTELHEQLMMVI